MKRNKIRKLGYTMQARQRWDKERDIMSDGDWQQRRLKIKLLFIDA
jgi:hypothetical protein